MNSTPAASSAHCKLSIVDCFASEPFSIRVTVLAATPAFSASSGIPYSTSASKSGWSGRQSSRAGSRSWSSTCPIWQRWWSRCSLSGACFMSSLASRLQVLVGMEELRAHHSPQETNTGRLGVLRNERLYRDPAARTSKAKDWHSPPKRRPLPKAMTSRRCT